MDKDWCCREFLNTGRTHGQYCPENPKRRAIGESLCEAPPSTGPTMDDPPTEKVRELRHPDAKKIAEELSRPLREAATSEGATLIVERDQEWCIALAKHDIAAIAHSVRHGEIGITPDDPETELSTLRARLAEVERERDTAAAKAKLMVCCYCGKERPKPEPFTKDTMLDEILEHLKQCPTHPANAYLKAMDEKVAVEARNGELERDKEQLCGDVKAIQQDYSDAHRRVEELEKAIREAVQLVRCWHGMKMPKPMEEMAWKAYQSSPEMKSILAALQSGDGEEKA